jgi:hypothetical protein
MKLLSTKLTVECLEDRTVPATLVSPHVLTYQDIDGDNVTVTFSLPVLSSNNVNDVFHFNVGNVNGSDSQRQQLQDINISIIPREVVDGTDITVAAVQSQEGDGRANIGSISVYERTLGNVSIGGDLGRITASLILDDGPTVLQRLFANSIGKFGLSTQEPGGSLTSLLVRNVGTIETAGDIVGARILLASPDSSPSLDSLIIHGSLRGTGDAQSGQIDIRCRKRLGGMLKYYYRQAA